MFCHDQRAYPRACLPHISLNELLEAREARGGDEGKMDAVKAEDTDKEKRKKREYMRPAVKRDSEAELY